MRAIDRFTTWSNDMWPLRNTILSVVPRSLRDASDADKVFDRPWDSIRFFQSILATRVLHSNIAQSARIHPTVVIEGNVHIGAGATIHPYAHIVGPVSIGEQAEIGDFSLVRSSVVGNHSTIGARSEIVRSVIGQFTTTHLSFVGDSIISPRVEVTAGDTLTGYNLRGKPVSTLYHEQMEHVGGKLGVLVGTRTSIGMLCGVLPGIKIGERCTILPGAIVSRDIQDGRTVKSESPITIYPRQ